MQCLSGMGALSRTLVFSNANAPSFQTLSHWIYSRTLGISSCLEILGARLKCARDAKGAGLWR